METSKSTQPLASTQIRELAPGIHNPLPALTADARILSITPGEFSQFPRDTLTRLLLVS